MNPVRVHVHDSLGGRIGTLTTASSINRAWTLMQPTQASVRCSLDDPLLTGPEGSPDNLHPFLGRAIVIESDDYPYPWVGGLTRAADNGRDGSVELSAMSLDAVLKDRYLPADAAYANAAGQVVRLILADGNAANDSGLAPADDLALGPPYAGAFPDRTLYGALTAVAKQSGYEWWLEYDVTPRGIGVSVHFGPARGLNRFRDVRLTDGLNCERVESAIDLGGSVHSLRVVAGQSSVLQAFTGRARVQAARDSSGRFVAAGSATAQQIGAETVIDGEFEVEHFDRSQSVLTRAEGLAVAENLKSAGAIGQAAAVLLGRPRTAERLLKLRLYGAPEDDPGRAAAARELWGGLEVGTRVRVTSRRAFLGAGFDGPVRVVGVQPHEEIGDAELVCQVLRRRA